MEVAQDSQRPISNSKRLTLSVFIPFFNEKNNISSSVENALKTLAKNKAISEYEVIIVDDGSSDGTTIIGHDLASKHSEVRVISHTYNRGYGAALITGFTNAKYEYIFFTDGDLQFDIEDISKFLQYIPEYECVIGYRLNRKDSFVRILYSYFWNTLNRLFFDLRVRDINCAFKIIKKSCIEDIVFLSQGAMISAELLIRLRSKGVVLKEIPVRHFIRKYEEASGGDMAVVYKALVEFFMLCKDCYKEVRYKNVIFVVLLFIISCSICLYFIGQHFI